MTACPKCRKSVVDGVWRFKDMAARADISCNSGELRAIAREAWEAADRVGDPSTYHNPRATDGVIVGMRKFAAEVWNRAAAFDELEGEVRS